MQSISYIHELVSKIITSYHANERRPISLQHCASSGENGRLPAPHSYLLKLLIQFNQRFRTESRVFILQLTPHCARDPVCPFSLIGYPNCCQASIRCQYLELDLKTSHTSANSKQNHSFHRRVQLIVVQFPCIFRKISENERLPSPRLLRVAICCD